MRRCAPLVLLLACGAPSEKSTPATSEACTAALSVSPELSLGEVSVTSDVSAEATLTVENTGDCTTSFAASLDDALGVFAIAAPSTATLAPGESAQLPVTFTPTADLDADASITIVSESLPSVSVAVRGSGLAPVLSATPAAHDFGLIAPGCDEVLPITLQNVGREPLVIDGLSFDTAGTALDFDANETIFSTGAEVNGPLPWTLLPDESLEVFVTYRSPGPSLDDALLEITSNDPAAPVVVLSQEGEVSAGTAAIDTFTYGPGPVDIVLAVNGTASMSGTLSALDLRFSVLTDALDAEGIDYQLAVVVQDDGVVAGSADYISPDTADVDAAIGEMLSGTPGDNAEKPLTLLESALLATDGPGGWLRPAASLHLAMLSDVADQSTDKSWDRYVTDYQNIDEHVTIHAIGGDYPAGCGGASAFTGAYEATIMTDGVFLSICADMSDNLVDLAEEIVSQQGLLYLSGAAVPETLSATVDGTPSSDWLWDDQRDTVVFNPEPADGAVVEISYTVASCR